MTAPTTAWPRGSISHRPVLSSIRNAHARCCWLSVLSSLSRNETYWSGRYGHIEIVWCNRVRRQSLHHPVPIRVSIEVVIECKYVCLNKTGPLCHDLKVFKSQSRNGRSSYLEFPHPVFLMLHLGRHSFVIPPSIVRTANDKLGYSTRDIIAVVCMDDMSRRSRQACPVWIKVSMRSIRIDCTHIGR